MAARIALREAEDVVLAYCDPGSEHPDNERFLGDLEVWFDREIVRLKSERYTDTWDVFERTGYLVSAQGARCSTELKKLVRNGFERPDDRQVFGFTIFERKRAVQFRRNNPEVDLWCPLIEQDLAKEDCLAILARANIVLPAMYLLGFNNNNCVGCPKGGMGYWNKIREEFPEVFARMALVERKIGVSICFTKGKGAKRSEITRVFLDELDPDQGDYPNEHVIECGPQCTVANNTYG